jgi:hypothetical protein
MHLTAPMTPYATTQQAMAETIDVNHHRVLVFHHSSHRMGFQTELLSDKRLDEHLESDPFVVGPQEHNNEIGKRCSFHHCQPATSCIYGASAPITLLGHEPNNARNRKRLVNHRRSGAEVMVVTAGFAVQA